jgi:galactokinase
MAERKEYLSKEFKKIFGAEPTLWTRAPGRVDLMGSHTDYNMGYVMTMTIDRDTWIAATPRDDGKVKVYSLDMNSGAEFSLDDLSKEKETPWTNYVRGIAKYCIEAGYQLKGFNGLIHSTVPFSAGLSSSAALEMAVAMMFQAVGGFDLDPVEMALIGQKAENLFIGVNSGILDQYSSAMGEEGKTVLLDCRALTSSLVDISDELAIVIGDTKSKRNLLGSEYDDRRSQCEQGVAILQTVYPDISALRDASFDQFNAIKEKMPEVIQKRCQFILEENQRVLDLAKPLSENDTKTLRETFTTSYLGARDLYEIGAPAMEDMYQSMLNAPGVVAARQTGAGFGGCMVALVKPALVDEFSSSVITEYKQRTGLDAEIYAVRASAGASIIES